MFQANRYKKVDNENVQVKEGWTFHLYLFVLQPHNPHNPDRTAITQTCQIKKFYSNLSCIDLHYDN